ncbi:MAG: FG-GAP-like repeat-containing protein, partial [Actinomycetota bacterium]|nr:FG-GAP-like repeat-containing protein [Actinomycetota bacterium]
MSERFQSGEQGSAAEADHQLKAPTITLPKGGGALQSIGEKFHANPATGTGSLTVPIAASPGRAGFGPALALSYDSGAGNGPFGLGWDIGLPSIIRKTQKGLPRYEDERESDTFILSGAEDLVPALVEQDDGTWKRETVDDEIYSTHRGERYSVYRYRPRVEGLFARIERWVRRSDGDTHWRAITRDNRTTFYGETEAARVVHPNDSNKVFQWLIERSYDDNGNTIIYEYKSEDMEAVEPRLPYERNRLRTRGAFSQKYLKRVRYGNSRPYLILLNNRGGSTFDEAGWEASNRWLFELVFDYGEHQGVAPSPAEAQPWPVRRDAFSSYRAGFEIRTYRLCRRVLMFHHFEPELGPDPYLVRSTNLTYSENPVATQLREVSHWSHEAGQDPAPMPPVRFTYSQAEVDEEARTISEEAYNLPDGHRHYWLDLVGEGLTGILSQHEDAWYYRRNLSAGRFGSPELVASTPSVAAPGHPDQYLTDLDGDGRLNLVSLSPGLGGYFELNGDDQWDAFTAFRHLPNLDWADPNLRLIDLTGDGHPDILITEDDCMLWHTGEAEVGYGAGQRVAKAWDEEEGPTVVFADAAQSIYLADMSGDGLTDIVRIRNGDISYWPNTGYGTFGARVTMVAPPRFDGPDTFDPRRIRLGDIDGTGTADVFYLGADGLRYWHNQAGNAWSEAHELSQFPRGEDPASLQVMDLIGNGTACVVWTSFPPSGRPANLRYIPLMSTGKPYLLTEVDNGMGAITRLQYAPSTKFYLGDREAGRPWITRLPFPVHVVERVETYDAISRNRFVSHSAYHHGYFDGEEREFRGFGMVEQWDTQWYSEFGEEGLFPVGANHLDEASHVPPVRTKTWFHNGSFMDRGHISRQYAHEYYQGDGEAWLLPDTVLPPGLSAEEQREACRALKGRMLRQEVYGLDGTEREHDPYSVVEAKFHLRREQPRDESKHAVFYVCDCETLTYHYERDPTDPRIAHAHTLEIDKYGNVLKGAAIAYPRRRGGLPEQERMHVTYTENEFIHLDQTPWAYRTGLPTEQRSYEISGLPVRGPWEKEELVATIASAAEASHTAPRATLSQKRLLARTRTRYYRDSLDECLAWGEAGSLGIPCEQLRLTFTEEILDQPELGGRITPELLREGGYRNDIDTDPTHWWIPSGRRLYEPARAPEMFYLPIGVEDPFGKRSLVEYDAPYYLFPVRVADPVGNVSVAENDYRVLAPFRLTGPNANRSEVVFDTRGMVIATAVMGKAGEGDAEQTGDSVGAYDRIPIPVLDGVPEDVTPAIIADPHRYLQSATTFFHYDLFAWQRDRAPAVALGLARDIHAPLEGATLSPVQVSLSYSDGFARTILTKVQAEDGLAPVYDSDGDLLLDEHGKPDLAWSTDRWVGNGAAVFNNKGLPVRQYEPFFDSRPDFTDEDVLVNLGVSPMLRYDPLGRSIRTDLPDGSFSRVEFDPWQQAKYDPNDTVLESLWYVSRGSPAPSGPEPTDPASRAAWLAAKHADTPTLVYLDALGRPFVSIAHNRRRYRVPGGSFRYEDEYIPARTELDLEGNPLAIYDGRQCEGVSLEEAVRHRGNTVMTYTYAMGGVQLYQKSMDAGERRALANVAANPIHGWDERGHHLHTRYDELQRPTHLHVDIPQDDGGTRTILA